MYDGRVMSETRSLERLVPFGVTVLCVSACGPETHEQQHILFSINLLPPEAGGWKVRAWMEILQVVP
jgi:hypothetical protein